MSIDVYFGREEAGVVGGGGGWTLVGGFWNLTC